MKKRLNNTSAFTRFARQNSLLDLEELDEDELDRVRGEYEELAKKSREELRVLKSGMDAAEVKETS